MCIRRKWVLVKGITMLGFFIWSCVMMGVVVLCINIDNFEKDGGE